MFAQQENVICKENLFRSVDVAQVRHFIDYFFMPANGHTVVADGSGVVAAKGAVMRTTPRSEHRVMGVARQVVQAAIHERQLIEGRGLRPALSPDEAAVTIAKD